MKEVENMFLHPFGLEKGLMVAEIVSKDYRTADVFRKYGIEYCCGGKLPLQSACEVKGVSLDRVLTELEEVTRDVQIPGNFNFNEWDIDFLTDYLVNIHHQYLRKNLPQLQDHIERFAEGHRKKYPYVDDLQRSVNQLVRTIYPHLDQEEEIIFPYIRQIGHAYHSRASYASLLVRTLRKPVEDIMQHEHDGTVKVLKRWRDLTNDYSIPSHACVSHQVVFKKLKEIDNDLCQHLHLENNILFPKAINMEKELLRK
jgi:regulator of cell morphogenesis and NO signaling